MKGERFRGVIEVADEPPKWPSHYVVTDRGVYEYTGQKFAKRAAAPEGCAVQGLSEAVNVPIREVRGDGELAVILLESGDIIVFSLELDPFGTEIQSWPAVSFSHEAEAATWKDEYDQMNLLE